MERLEFVEDEHLDYLDLLRDSGQVNMLGYAENIREEFGVGKKESREIVSYWMKSFRELDR
jgi:hypothetical protein